MDSTNQSITPDVIVRRTDITDTPKRLTDAIVTLLDASERAAVRGNHPWACLYAAKASEASARLHNLSMDTLERSVVNRRVRDRRMPRLM